VVVSPRGEQFEAAEYDPTAQVVTRVLELAQTYFEMGAALLKGRLARVYVSRYTRLVSSRA
jgi:hypothetical protein